MNNQNNNQDLTKIIQDGQRNNRLATVATILQVLTTAVFFGLTVWSTWKRKRPSLKIRLIRQKGRIEKMKLRHKAEIDRGLLELEILEREMKHQAGLKEFEVGLERQEEKEILAKTNSLNELKQKGESFLKDKIFLVYIRDK